MRFLLLCGLLAAPLVHAQDADRMPELIGGIESVAEQLRYPDTAKQAGIEGRVLVQFVVDEAGAVQDARIAEGLGGGLSEEALRVVRGLTFEPGLKDGQPVKVALTLPVQFRLPEKEGPEEGNPEHDG